MLSHAGAVWVLFLFFRGATAAADIADLETREPRAPSDLRFLGLSFIKTPIADVRGYEVGERRVYPSQPPTTCGGRTAYLLVQPVVRCMRGLLFSSFFFFLFLGTISHFM